MVGPGGERGGVPPARIAPIITFRDAVEADLPAVVRLLADDRLGQGRERDETPLPDSYVQGFRAMLAQGGRLILAEQGGVVVGCLQFNVIHGVSQQGRTRAQVEGVRVDSARQGGEIGAALMLHAMAEAAAAGCGMMQLITDSTRTEAQALYARLGFSHSYVRMKADLTCSRNQTKKRTHKFPKVATIVIFLVFVPILSIGIFNSLAPFVNIWLQKFVIRLTKWPEELGLPADLGSFTTVYVALGLGWLAFELRKRKRRWYGLVEVFFGTYGGGVALLLLYEPGQLPKGFEAFTSSNARYSGYVGLISSIYVIVRGLDNLNSSPK